MAFALLFPLSFVLLFLMSVVMLFLKSILSGSRNEATSQTYGIPVILDSFRPVR